MSDNYQEEVKPLLRHLRTEAFRFIIVRYNHYDLLRRLEQDLKSKYPNREFQKLNSEKLTFQEISEKYYQQKNGFCWLENFDAVLRNSNQNPKNSKITAGLNLRRDTLAKTPIALFVLVRADENLYGREIMQKMPDLWSVRSLMLDLAQEIQINQDNIHLFSLEQRDNIEALAQEKRSQKVQELENLQMQVAKTPETELVFLEELYRQIADLQVELGKYELALMTLEQWEKIAEDKSFIFTRKGDIYTELGKIQEAKAYFSQASQLFEAKEDLDNLATAYERLGVLESSVGNLQESLALFEKYNHLQKELYEKFPENVGFKNGLVISYEKLGKIQSSVGNLEKALEFFEEMNRLFKELYEAFPENVKFKNGLAISYQYLGNIQSSVGNLEKALEFFEEMNRLFKELYKAFPENVSFKNGLAISYEKLGQTQSSVGNLEKALEFFEEDLKLTKELYEAFPENVDFKNGLAISYQYLGHTQSNLGNLEKALEFFEAYNTLEKELYKVFPENVDFKNNLAISYVKLFQVSNKKEYLEASEKLFTELVQQSPENAQFKEDWEIVKNALSEVE